MTPEQRKAKATENAKARAIQTDSELAREMSRMSPEERENFQRRRGEAQQAMRLADGEATLEEEAERLLGDAAVDLHDVPGEHWDGMVGRSVRLPSAVENALASKKKLSQKEVDALEDQLMDFYDVKPPFWIQITLKPVPIARLDKPDPHPRNSPL